MILEMKVPSPGESISEVEIAEWLVKDGDYVEKDQTIAEVDSDKATLDLPAEQSGVITLKANEGDAVEVGSVICLIDTSAKAPKPHWAKPKSQKGTVDPMTAIHLIMGDRIEKKLCKQKFNLFDGARRIEITLSKIDIQKNSAQCRGDYIRQDGYTAEEMKEGKVFPFTINYIKRDNVYAVESLEIKALRGRTKFTRR